MSMLAFEARSDSITCLDTVSGVRDKRAYRRYLRKARRYSVCCDKSDVARSVSIRVLSVLAGSLGVYVTIAGVASILSLDMHGFALDASMLSVGVLSASFLSGDAQTRKSRRAVKASRSISALMSEGLAKQAQGRSLATLLCAGSSGKLVFWQMLEHAPSGLREETELRSFLEALAGWRQEGAELSREDVRSCADSVWVLYNDSNWRKILSIISALPGCRPSAMIKDAGELSMLSTDELELAEEMTQGWLGDGSALAGAVVAMRAI